MKKAKVKATGAILSKRGTYTETLTQILSCRFLKIMNTTLNTSARLPLKQCQEKSLLFTI